MTTVIPTDCPYYLISRASLAITNALRQELISAGLHQIRPSYLGVLMCLWLEDGLKVVELGKRAGLEPSTMTSLLDRMEQDQLLTRQADQHDRRALRIHLTPAGRKAKSVVMEVTNHTLQKVLSNLETKEIETLKQMLKHILQNVQQEEEV